MRRMDEMEKYQSGNAARFLYGFYTIVLLIWAIIDYVKLGDAGWQLSIVLVGSAIYLWILVYYKKKNRSK